MQLRRLLYYSRSTLDPATYEEQVREILAVAVANNNKRNVTGALTYDRHWFAQALEGDLEDVTFIFNKIKHDPRHSDIVIMENGAVTERLFPYWWMVSVSWEEAQATTIQRFAGTENFDPRTIEPKYLLGLMEAVVKMQTRRPLRADIGAAQRR